MPPPDLIDSDGDLSEHQSLRPRHRPALASLFSRPPSARSLPFPSSQLDDLIDSDSPFTTIPATPSPTPCRSSRLNTIPSIPYTPNIAMSPIRRRISSNNSTPRTPRDRFIPSSANVQSFRMGSASPATRSGRAATESPTTADGSFFPVYNPGSSRTIGLGGPNSPARLAAAHQTGYVGGNGVQRTISAGSVGVFGIGVIAGGGMGGHGSPDAGGRVVNGNIFNNRESQEAANARHENLLSEALDVDRTRRVLEFGGGENTRSADRKNWWSVGSDSAGIMGTAPGGIGVDGREFSFLKQRDLDGVG